MRPPMGAGSHQATKSANSMGFIMPLYTIGIVSFFIYTIMKLIFKKSPATPYAEVKPDPAFRNEVFTTEQYIKRPDDGTTKLEQSHVTAATNGELVVPVAVSSVSSAVNSAEPSTVQSELSIDYEQLSRQKELSKPDQSIAVAQVLLDHEPQDAGIESTEAVAAERGEEFFSEPQLTHDPTTEKVVDGIVVKKVVAFEESAKLPSRSALEDVEETKVQEECELKPVNGASSAVNGDIEEMEAQKELEVDEPVIEEVMLVQQASMQTAAIAPSKEDQTIAAEPIDEPDSAQQKELIGETTSVEEPTNLEPKENIQNETGTEVLAEELEEPIAACIVSAELQESSEVREMDAVQSSSEIENVEPIVQEAAVNTSIEPSPDQAQQDMSEIGNTPMELVESIEKEESIDVTYPKRENEPIQNSVVEEPTEPVSNITQENKETQEIISEDIPHNEAVPEESEQKLIPDDTIIEQQSEPELVPEQTVNLMELAADTSDLVHKTVEDITLTAEQLVQEVLEHAEELAKQHDQFPELPEYDPATQKLVDGIVVERFEHPETEQTEDTGATVSHECSDEVTQELTLDEMELAAVVEQTLMEEDAGEMDSISEDNSLSVASVIEQQPKGRESEESNTVSDVVRSTDELVGSDDATFVETKDVTTNETMPTAEAVQDLIDVTEPGNKSGVAVVDSNETGVVIEQQPVPNVSEEHGTLSEALITTELLTSCTSSEPVFVELNDQPTVEAETVLEETTKIDGAAGNLSGAAAVDSNDSMSVSIEEVHDEAAIVDEVEGKVIEEHIIPISIEKASMSDTMTITEVTSDDAIVESPNLSKTASNMPSPSVTAVPVMDTIDEKQESVEQSREQLHDQQKQPEISLTTLEHVTKEALVERTLNEAAAVVNEIESIVDHIITEKLIHSGTSEGIAATNGLPEASPQEPPRLAASAALIVEAIESKSPGVHSMISSRDSTQNMQTITVTNGLTTNLDETIGDTNPPASGDSLPIVSPSFASAPTPSSEAFPVPVPTVSSPPEVVSNASTFASVSETHSINLVADEQRSTVTADGQGAKDAVDDSGIQGTASSAGQRVAVTDLPSAATTTIGQVPTSVSNVTNPKFLTLNLANYSTSDSSGNNSKSSSLSIANLSQSGASLAGGDSADQLMELELLRKKLDETERAMTKIIANMGNIPKGQETNVNADEPVTDEKETAAEVTVAEEDHAKVANGHAVKPVENSAESESSEKETSGGESSSANSTPEKKPKKRDTSTERGTVKVMAMEVTAQRENGKRLSRPSTPLLPMGGHSDAAHAPTEEQETRSIVLDGRLPHDSKILVSDAETAVEKLETDNSEEEDDAPVILSGKMTLSLINMDFIEKDATGTVAVGATPGRTASGPRTINITRGIQTITPTTTNRYCQVSVARKRKPTATVEVQTEECVFYPPQPSLPPPPPPPPVILLETGCQTDDCQADVVEELNETQNNGNGEQHQEQQERKHPEVEEPNKAQNNGHEEQHQEQQEEQDSEVEEDPSSLVESISTVLNDIAKKFGIDLQSSAEKKEKKFKSKKKEIEHLKECLAKKTYKVIASRVNANMSKIIEKHMTVYGRETVASRQRLIRWTKHFLRRQQLVREAGRPLRKIILVRKIVRAPKPPTVEEKAVQYEQVSTGITVGTQWERQKPTVTKKKPVSSRTGIRRSMRQTKLSSYTTEQDDGKTVQDREQQRKQQGEHSPKPSKPSAEVRENPPASAKTTKASTPPRSNKKKKRNEQKSPSIDIHIEETPSPQHSEPEHERKYLPYRSPPRYPTQCSKSTETSFLTPTRLRSFAPERMDIDRQSHSRTRPYNPAVLLSPMERMYMDSRAQEPTNRPGYNTFLVPLRTNESVPPTPSSRMMYMNPTERRVLLRSGPTSGGMVREKPPEVSIISSQQLYSQIGLAVEKALKNKSLPTLATMYGEPFIEVFNGCDEQPVEQNKPNADRLEAAPSNSKATEQKQSAIADKFVCSSGKEDVNLQGSQQLFTRPPFHTERSPSLSPIIYQDENSEDEMIL
uniref:Resistance to inhibitors of cholinesterase protein 3 N-terminal domain-containing protein n=1 Tax=Anopheles minimus TaxID=112268 RepID=A0A182WMB7_9DIPT